MVAKCFIRAPDRVCADQRRVDRSNPANYPWPPNQRSRLPQQHSAPTALASGYVCSPVAPMQDQPILWLPEADVPLYRKATDTLIGDLGRTDALVKADRQAGRAARTLFRQALQATYEPNLSCRGWVRAAKQRLAQMIQAPSEPGDAAMISARLAVRKVLKLSSDEPQCLAGVNTPANSG
jgi:hypothetical protein